LARPAAARIGDRVGDPAAMSDLHDREFLARSARMVVYPVPIGAVTTRDRDAVQQVVEAQLLDEQPAVLVDVH
jgi:hypothetical protein